MGNAGTRRWEGEGEQNQATEVKGWSPGVSASLPTLLPLLWFSGDSVIHSLDHYFQEAGCPAISRMSSGDSPSPTF